KEDKAPIDLTGLSVGELFTLVERPLFSKAAGALEQKLSNDEYRAKLALKGLSLLGTTAAFQAVEAFIGSEEEPHSFVRSHAVKAIGRTPASL
ncbi:MAG: hypothetical protein H8E73_10270, partial [Planctomycetes bacterium]|nr:hypothetical protein [Planctomycetota bacterium]